MGINANAQFIENYKPVTGLPPITPSSSTPDYVSLKGYNRCAIVIMADNAATVTGSAITVKQATAVAGTGEKAVSFTRAWRSIDVDAASGDNLAEFAVTSDTFTTDVTNNKNLLYVIEVDESDLDIAGGFDCVRAGTANAVNTVLSVLYVLGPRKYGTAALSAIAD